MFQQLARKHREKIAFIWAEMETLPQMKDIINNLPDGITFSVSCNGMRSSAYNYGENEIEMDITNFNAKSLRRKMDFLISLSHELCHATQKNAGLYFTDIKNASFGDTFRIGKLMEIETFLMHVMIERELLKRPQYKNVCPTASVQYFQKRFLLHKKNNVPDAEGAARADLISVCWQCGHNHHISEKLGLEVRSNYDYYNRQAMRFAQLMHHPKLAKYKDVPTTPPQYTASEIKTFYRCRMGVFYHVPAGYFLTDKSDYAHVDTYEKGVDIFDANYRRYINYNICPDFPSVEVHTLYNGNKKMEKRFYSDDKQVADPTEKSKVTGFIAGREIR